ncbi:MAG: hypothetical protein KHZ62_04530 [Clostridiales bacterium]|nr:hypothetical protein [Clostridiales bacterium]
MEETNKEETKIYVNVDKTVVKITGLDIKGLNIQQVEKILQDKLKSMTRIIGVTGDYIEMDVYGIEEEDILREENGIIKAIAVADGIKLSDVAQISSVKKIKEVPFDQVPEYVEGNCLGERWVKF